MSFCGDISIEKNNHSPPIDSFEIKIMNDLKNLKEMDKNEKIEKLKKVFEESLDHFVPKEYRKIFISIFKEFDDIYKNNLNDIKQINEKKEELKEKLKSLENENFTFKKKLE